MSGWELPALGAFLLVLIICLILYFASDAKGEAKGGAVAKDDRAEAERANEATQRAQEAMRNAPKTPRDLARKLRDRMLGTKD